MSVDIILQWGLNIVGGVGSVASCVGLWFTYKQIKDVRDVATKTAEAVKSNREEIRNFLSVSDASHLCERIKQTQQYITANDLKAAVMFMQTIKDDLLRMQCVLDKVEEKNLSLDEHIRTIGTDISNIFNEIQKKPKQETLLDSIKLQTNLETIRETVVRIEMLLKNKKL